MLIHGATGKLQCIPVTCLRGPHFLMAWNIRIKCNLLCAMHGIAMHGVAMHGVAMCVTAMQGTRLGKYLTTPYHKI